MKTLLDDGQNSSLRHYDGDWESNSQNARASSRTSDLEPIMEVKSVTRIAPSLLARLAFHAPGIYQAGE